MMKILAIETSCDETAISLVEAVEEQDSVWCTVLGDALLSQIELHKEYGGVFPNLAKREHAKNLVPLLSKVLSVSKETPWIRIQGVSLDTGGEKRAYLKKLLEREPELFSRMLVFLSQNEKPDIDAVAVTRGPGLEPALWVGINFAKTLAYIWEKPLIPVNHMEGHILSALMKEVSNTRFLISDTQFPVLALLISGGHTELVLMKAWGSYEIIGETLDDAVGEAFDKVARMMNLPYPGGPEISKLAEVARDQNITAEEKLPRPMLHTDDCNFSFSGLKTAVLYTLKNIPNITEKKKKEIAREFEAAVTDVLISKTKKALGQTGAKTLVIGGGVSANKNIRRMFTKIIKDEYPDIMLSIPSPKLSTDNAIMIAVAAYFKTRSNKKMPEPEEVTAHGTMRL